MCCVHSGQEEYLAFLKTHGINFDAKYLGLADSSAVPPGRTSLFLLFQALRASYFHCGPSGTILCGPNELLVFKLALMG